MAVLIRASDGAVILPATGFHGLELAEVSVEIKARLARLRA